MGRAIFTGNGKEPCLGYVMWLTVVYWLVRSAGRSYSFRGKYEYEL